MYKTTPPPPAPAANPRGPQVDLSRLEAARQQHLIAEAAHQKASEKVRILQQKKEATDEKIRGLTAAINDESCPKLRKILEGCIKKHKISRTKRVNDVKEAMVIEERARKAEEEAEHDWWFEKNRYGTARSGTGNGGSN
ncbi:unnamed protein product [Caenorhabditis nigoni]